MISKKAVEEFKNRKLESFDWIKKASVKELEEAIASLPAQVRLKNKFYKHQKASFYVGACLDEFSYFLDMGTGKAQPLDALIMTPKGYKQMGDLKIGDVISHPIQHTSKIIAIHPQKERAVYKVTFGDNSFTECCENHLWAINTAQRNRKNLPYRTKALKDFKDDLTDNGYLHNRKHFIPITQSLNLEQYEHTLKSLHPYVLGVLLGDGSLSNNGASFTSTDPELAEKVRSFLPIGVTLVHPENSLLYRIRSKQGNLSQQNHTNFVLLAIRKLKLNGTTSHTKFVPKSYLYTSIQNRLEILRGLIDTDGYVSNGGEIIYTSASKQLATDVQFIAQSLGCTARFKQTTYSGKIEKYKGNIYYDITIRTSFGLDICTLPRKLNRLKNKKYGSCRSIKSVEFIGYKFAQCITIDKPDGLYLTNDFIVTHNSLISLALILYRQKLFQIQRALIIVPNVLNLEGWAEEIQKQTNLEFRLLYGTKEERLFELEQESDIYIINYAGLQTVMASLQKQHNKKQKKRVPDTKLIRKFTSKFQMVVFDEIHICKNKESLIYKLCNQISKNCTYRLGMTGTPFGRNPIDFWAQFYLVDRGLTLGSTLGMYRAAFFEESKNIWGGNDYSFNKESEPALHKMIKNRSLRYKDSECGDLPRKVSINVPIRLAPDALEYYKQLVEESYETLDTQDTRMNYYAKFRQISSGFVYIKDEEFDTRVALRFSYTEKLDAIDIVLDEIPKTSSLIIFHVFTESGELITEHLKKKKINFAALNSTAKAAKTSVQKEYQRFKKEKQCRVAVVNIASGSTGLNLQKANYSIFYEPTDRPIWQRQSEKRTHRDGQTKRCYNYYFYVPNTVEDQVRTFLKEGKSLFDALVEGKEDMRSMIAGFNKLKSS